ncbi:hypothetical protein MMC10_007335 [Thelotrema lepadinum]|nr:hypothetical protein [Thelotrema lepadinum]
MQHASLFSYNVQRSYPFRWFTPVVVVGTLIALILVSFINVATTGYELVSVASADPNSTEQYQTWFETWPSFLIGNSKSTCASTTIPINSRFQTNNTALSYTLQGVWSQDEAGHRTAAGSLVYQNNLLQNCSVSSVQIQLENIGRSASQIAIQQIGASATAFTTCFLSTPQGSMALDLSTTYDYVPDNISPASTVFTFQGRNVTDLASLYFGETLLSMYWIDLTNAYYVANKDPKYQLYSGTLTLQRSSKPPTTTDGIKSLDFFTQPSCFFIPFNGTGLESEVQYCAEPTSISALSNGKGNGTAPLPPIWIPADSFSKALYYTIMADLGQNNPLYPSALVDQGLLEYYTANFTDIAQYAHGGSNQINGENVSPDSRLAKYPFTVAQNGSQYVLAVNASTLAIDYLCQIPQLKPAGTLIFAVLVADLVLLQGLWKLFKLVIDSVLVKRYPSMKVCEGCLERERMDREEGGVRLSTLRGRDLSPGLSPGLGLGASLKGGGAGRYERLEEPEEERRSGE